MLIARIVPAALSFLLLASSVVANSQTIGWSTEPYTATKTETLVQKLADGTTMTQVSNLVEARDSQGRTMQKRPTKTFKEGDGVTLISIMDPVAHTTTHWTSNAKNAVRFHMSVPVAKAAVPGGHLPNNEVMTQNGSAFAALSLTTVSPILGSTPSPQGTPSAANSSHPAQTMEKLGSKTMAGVYAEGVRLTITYPIGFFGNDRPIVEVRETWTSPDLKIIMLNSDDDPRQGLRTTEVTNIDRVEPDPSIFQVPDGYQVKDTYPGVN
ncbi:hypothetical protein [Edaphobacter modestus]|uniref:Outer membrane lipoprotein-sorting protein n=1 Tax=Edaphobacter modestus TaxID=388466 RepID=A0A4Q7YS58_9BACT|nr:hypothetical protein [Edaphobacter modestus]RZU39811.1 hypothetical protein BDD14_1206 [Edaphobacter modestus]